MFLRRSAPPRLETERLVLRLPVHADFHAWTGLREQSRAFLTPWEPVWHADHLSRRAFTNRVYWAARASRAGTALPLFMIRRDGVLVGAVTLDTSLPPRTVATPRPTAREPRGRCSACWLSAGPTPRRQSSCRCGCRTGRRRWGEYPCCACRRSTGRRRERRA